MEEKVAKLKNLLEKLISLKKEQEEYREAISSLVDDGADNDSAAIRTLKSCKSRIDREITSLGEIAVRFTCPEELLHGIQGIRTAPIPPLMPYKKPTEDVF